MADETTTDRILVAYATKFGATAEIAEAIGKTLESAGLQVDVRPARDVESFGPYRAVVLGSGVYMGRWRREAARLLRRRKELDARDVWFFSSGPTGEPKPDETPEQIARWTRPKRVEKTAVAVGAHEHVVFGGRVSEGGGFISRKMVENTPPEFRDRRDWAAIEAWARGIAAALSPATTAAPPPAPAPATPEPPAQAA
jgi:menaquinone-dependent protoporphyrinogen oxidase